MHRVYLRVSTDHQDEANQRLGVINWITSHGNPPIVITTDTASGALPWRKRRLLQVLQDSQPGDTIICAEVSRIGRSTVDVLDFFKAALDRDITVIVTKSGLTVDHSLQSKITTTMLALASEIEREFLLARTQEGLERARAAGVRLGRPPGAKSANKLQPFAAEVERLAAARTPHAAIARIFKVSRGTVSRFFEARRAGKEGEE